MRGMHTWRALEFFPLGSFQIEYMQRIGRAVGIATNKQGLGADYSQSTEELVM